MSDPRYPIGLFIDSGSLDPETRAAAIDSIEAAPLVLRKALRGLSNEQLATPYRDGGWTLRQVVHHVADSHINAYTRMRLALTESNPVIKPYDEKSWAALPDASDAPIGLSLALLDALHARWGMLLRTLSTDQFVREFSHPEHGPKDIDWLIAIYAWHGAHHTAHITELRTARGW